jgi:hypothetical protein
LNAQARVGPQALTNVEYVAKFAGCWAEDSFVVRSPARF